MLVIVRPEDPAGAAVAGVASEMLRAEATRSLGDRTVSVGIGSACHRIEDFSRSFAEARYCLELVYRFGNVDRSLAIDELGLHRFLIGSQSQTQLSQFAHQRLDRLIQYDRRRRGELLETLTAYLAAECSLLRTAEALVLHVNTVQYRLHRIEQLTGARLRGPDGLMEIHLALLIAFLNPREFPEVKDLTFFCRPR
jgi:DNA-binding PucR family transcriptional regulator